ncbi:TRAF-type zinc finger domain-containing protein 1 isoform X3 [Ixodes scapularis]|uniref:TRAF-type zinc finger domain-containing protein 1 isoform X3 n=1 Tax=Ixodes scapularis TaxID=6945 RepID=UPI001A9CBA34|nr:TRAF-type zinc finger domain-containing protein 1 isoform X3 [Ixodes scapularis]
MSNRSQPEQEMPTEEKLCQNCQRLVTAPNFLVHSVHCQRNIVLCPECSSPVPRSGLEEHRRTHAPTRCPDCKCYVELQRLSEHKENDCAKRLVTCEFCELSCPCDTMPDHLEYCGSRTQECSGCGRLVMLRDRQHQCSLPVHFTDDADHVSEQLDILDISGPDADDDAYDQLWLPPPELLSRASSESSSVPDPYPPEEVQLPCEFCSLLCPMEDLILHQSGCGPMQQRREDHSPEPLPPESPQEQLVDMGPCEICDKLLPMHKLHSHQLGCILEPGQPAKQEREGGLPCELCQQCFPVAALARHQATCDLSPEEALLSDELYPAMAGGQLLTGQRWEEGGHRHDAR